MAKTFRGSDTSLVNTFQTLSLNSSASNGTLGAMLINEDHKYLLLKFFDNEATVTIVTSGATSATLTAIPPAGATSATLTSSWPQISGNQQVVINGQQRVVFFTNNSAAISWQSPLTTASTTTGIVTNGVQEYILPANVSKIKNPTITVGQLVYTPAPVQSVQEWTKLNALPYTSDIPAYFFLYQGRLNFWPTPSSFGNIISLNCQINVPDLAYSDYSTGTIATAGMVPGSNAIVGSGTSWTSQFPQNVDLTFQNLFLTVAPPKGDGYLYQIQKVVDDTHITLVKNVVSAPNVNGASYVIGQYPQLFPDFHDLLVYRALRVYFMSVVKDADKYQLYDNLSKEKLSMMTAYLSTKSVNVDLSETPSQLNPNLFTFASS